MHVRISGKREIPPSIPTPTLGSAPINGNSTSRRKMHSDIMIRYKESLRSDWSGGLANKNGVMEDTYNG